MSLLGSTNTESQIDIICVTAHVVVVTLERSTESYSVWHINTHIKNIIAALICLPHPKKIFAPLRSQQTQHDIVSQEPLSFQGFDLFYVCLICSMLPYHLQCAHFRKLLCPGNMVLRTVTLSSHNDGTKHEISHLHVICAHGY